MIKSNKIEITKTSLKAGSRERGFYSVRTEKQNKNILTKQITKNQITLLDCEAKRKQTILANKKNGACVTIYKHEQIKT